MSHITEEQIEWIYTRYDGDMINCANAVARQAVVSYVDQQAKELPVLPEHIADVLVITGPSTHKHMQAGQYYYTSSQLQAYGAACAAHAREMALSDAMQACKQLETAIDGGGNTYYRPADARQCVSAIEVLKGK
jgi:hypothetical protein